MLAWLNPARVGAAVRGKLTDIGHATRLFLRLLGSLPTALARARLVVDQVHFLSLIHI